MTTPQSVGRPKKVAPVIIRKEAHSSDFALEQIRDIVMPSQGEIIHDPALAAIDAAYLDDIAFNEEPVTIIIDVPPGDFAPQTQDVWCNGELPELFINGRWFKKAAIPLGVEVTVKRKVAEILMRAKPYTVRTSHDQQTEANPNPENYVKRTANRAVNMSIIGDTSAKAREWQHRIMREA